MTLECFIGRCSVLGYSGPPGRVLLGPGIIPALVAVGEKDHEQGGSDTDGHKADNGQDDDFLNAEVKNGEHLDSFRIAELHSAARAASLRAWPSWKTRAMT